MCFNYAYFLVVSISGNILWSDFYFNAFLNVHSKGLIMSVDVVRGGGAGVVGQKNVNKDVPRPRAQFSAHLFDAQKKAGAIVPAIVGEGPVLDVDAHEPLLPAVEASHPLKAVFYRSDFVESDDFGKYFQSSHVKGSTYIPGARTGAVRVETSKLSKSMLMDKAQNFILKYFGCPPDSAKVQSLIQLILIHSREDTPERYLTELVPNIEEIDPNESFNIKEGFYALIALTKNDTRFQFKSSVITKSSMQLLYSIFNFVHGEGEFSVFQGWICDQITDDKAREKLDNELKIKRYVQDSYEQYCGKIEKKYLQENTNFCLRHIDAIYLASLETSDILQAKAKFIAGVQSILNSADLSLENKAVCLVYAFGLQHEGHVVDLSKDRNDFKKWMTANFVGLRVELQQSLFDKIKELEFKFTSPTILLCNKAKFSRNFTAVKASFLKIFISLSTVKIKSIYESKFYVDGILKADLIDKFVKINREFASEILQEFPEQWNDENITKRAVSLFYAFTLQDPGEENVDKKQKQFTSWLKDFCLLNQDKSNKVASALFENFDAIRKLIPDFDIIITEATQIRLFFRPRMEPAVQVGIVLAPQVGDALLVDDVQVQLQIGEAAVNVVQEVSPRIVKLKNKTDEIKQKYLYLLKDNGLNITKCEKKFLKYIEEEIIASDFDLEDKHCLLFYAFTIILYPLAIDTYGFMDKFKVWLKNDVKLFDDKIDEIMSYPSPRIYKNNEDDFGFYYRGEKISFVEAVTDIKVHSNELEKGFLNSRYPKEIYALYIDIFVKHTHGNNEVDYTILNTDFATAVMKIFRDNLETLNCIKEISVLLFYAFSLRDPGGLRGMNKESSFRFWLQDFCGLEEVKATRIIKALFEPPATDGVFLIYVKKLKNLCEKDGAECFETAFKTKPLVEKHAGKIKLLKDKIEIIKVKYIDYLKLYTMNITACKQKFSEKMKTEFESAEYQELSEEDRNYLMFSAFAFFYYPSSLSGDFAQKDFEKWLTDNVKLVAPIAKKIVTPMPRVYKPSPTDFGFYYYGEIIYFSKMTEEIDKLFLSLAKGLLDAQKETQIAVRTLILQKIWPMFRMKVPFLAPTGVVLVAAEVGSSAALIQKFQKEYLDMQNKYFTQLQDLDAPSVIKNILDFESCFFNLDFSEALNVEIAALRLKSDLIRAAIVIKGIIKDSPELVYSTAGQQQDYGEYNEKQATPAEVPIFRAYYAERLQLIKDNLPTVKEIIHKEYPNITFSANDNIAAEQISRTFITGDRAEQCLPVVDAMAFVFKDSYEEDIERAINESTIQLMHNKLGIPGPFQMPQRTLPFPVPIPVEEV